jgi:starch-binding outer membrane protein, SusD/RagB family
MKKYIRIKTAILSFAVFLGATSCSDLIEVTPRQSIDSATALKDGDAINAAMNGVYDRFQSTVLYGRDFLAIPEALADNGRATNKSGRLNNEYNNATGAHFVNWTTAYFAINQLNLIIDALPNIKDLTQAQKDAVEGEASFLRALLYHDLLRAYSYDPGAEVAQYNRGGVPLLLKGVLALTSVTYPARASVSDCYTQVIKDLNNAIAKIPKASNSRAPIYATQGAAQALLSRVYLYNRDYANAAKLATDALGSGVGRFLDNAGYIGGFRSPSNPESMLELVYTVPENIGVNTSLQTTYTTLFEIGNRARTAGFGDLVPSATLLAAMESEKNGTVVLDIRRQLYELGTAGRGTAAIECTKFMGKNGTANLDNIPVMRISEMYFNRAEANYFLGKDADALADVNIVRKRVGLAELKDLKGAALLAEILKQKRIEFAFEGHRWFDMKRLGMDIVKIPATIPFTDFRILAQIPTGEITNNPNLKQNFGY